MSQVLVEQFQVEMRSALRELHLQLREELQTEMRKMIALSQCQQASDAALRSPAAQPESEMAPGCPAVLSGSSISDVQGVDVKAPILPSYCKTPGRWRRKRRAAYVASADSCVPADWSDDSKFGSAESSSCHMCAHFDISSNGCQDELDAEDDSVRHNVDDHVAGVRNGSCRPGQMMPCEILRHVRLNKRVKDIEFCAGCDGSGRRLSRICHYCSGSGVANSTARDDFHHGIAQS